MKLHEQIETLLPIVREAAGLSRQPIYTTDPDDLVMGYVNLGSLRRARQALKACGYEVPDEIKRK